MAESVYKTESVRRDDIILLNLQTFLPYICECVKVTDLLHYLHFFTKEHRRELHLLYCTNSVAAMALALNIICNDTAYKDEPGKFIALRDTLQSCGYTQIVQLLDSDRVLADTQYRQIIRVFQSSIEPLQLLPLLESFKVLHSSDVKEIRAEQKNHGNKRATWVLLMCLPNHSADWFTQTLKALIETGHEDMAKQLEPDLNKDLIAQKSDSTSPVASSDSPLASNTVTAFSEQINPNLGQHITRNQSEPVEKMDDIDQKLQKIKSQQIDQHHVSVLDGDTAVKNNTYEDGNYSISSPTHKKQQHAQADCVGKGQLIQYDREFLLSLQNSRLSKIVPPEATKFPEITLRVCLPRKHVTVRGTARDSDAKVSNNNNSDQIISLRSAETDQELLKHEHSNDIDKKSGDLEEMDFDSLLLCDKQGEVEGLASNVTVQASAGSNDSKISSNSKSDQLISQRSYVDFQQQMKLEHVNEIENLDQGEMDFDSLLLENIGLEVEEQSRTRSSQDIDKMPDNGFKDKDIPLRDYQKELAREGSEGANVIILAPTNTGKTWVACKIMQDHLRCCRDKMVLGHVIFIVENEALAFQQGEVCKKLLPAYHTKVISGSVQRDKKQCLKDFVDRRDILVVTAQVLLNCLILKEIHSLTRFSLLIFDECHHTDNQHRYNEIMSYYMDLKLRQHMSVLPQIVGLTASLGTGGNTDENKALEHMTKLLANMDAMFLCTVRQHKEELMMYENNPKEKTIMAKKRSNDKYRAAIVNIIERINNYMLYHPSIGNLSKCDEQILNKIVVPTGMIGSDQFLNWLSDFKKAIGRVHSEAAGRMLNPCMDHLKAYNKALMIHDDARIKDADNILRKMMQSFTPDTPVPNCDDTDRMLQKLYNDLQQMSFEEEPENPKLLKMQDIILDVLGSNENGRGIIFVKTRGLAKALIAWMHETNPLKRLNATEFVGQTASIAEGGMTKCSQKDALIYFKDGKHKIMVATSVAEEGLDITKCNLVIRYECVTNEIVRLQSRGRARAKDSHYFVLTSEGSGIVEKEEKNAILEQLMTKIVPSLDSHIRNYPIFWQNERLKIQEDQKLLEEMNRQERQSNMIDDSVELQCLTCRQFICMSDDVRIIKQSHHIVISQDINNRITSFRNPVQMYADEELKFDGTIFCANKGCSGKHSLGGVCEYKNVEFPLVKIKQLRFLYKSGEGRTFKKWKETNFKIASFTLDDLTTVVKQRLADLN